VWLSPQAAAGVLPVVLDAEDLGSRAIAYG
jgi:hypothetical protein